MEASSSGAAAPRKSAATSGWRPVIDRFDGRGGHGLDGEGAGDAGAGVVDEGWS